MDRVLNVLFVLTTAGLIFCTAVHIAGFFRVGSSVLVRLLVAGAIGAFIADGIAQYGLRPGRRGEKDRRHYAVRWMQKTFQVLKYYAVFSFVLSLFFHDSIVRTVSGIVLFIYARSLVTIVAAMRWRADRARRRRDEDNQLLNPGTLAVEPVQPQAPVPLEYGTSIKGSVPLDIHNLLTGMGTLLLCVVGFAMGAYLAYPFLPQPWRDLSRWVLAAGLGIVGGLLSEPIFRRSVQVRCPVCGGQMIVKSSIDVRYRCQRCQHVQMIE